MGHRLDITHIADWLSAAVTENAQWLSRVDEFGRPKKLMKFGGFREMVREADKAMALAIEKQGVVTVDPAHERIVAQLSDGYAMIEMLSEAALDRESAKMQHCIGNGRYDRDIRSESMRLLSLRDPHGNPHATFRVDRLSSIVVEFQGKQNRDPHPKYMAYIREFMKADGLRFSHGGENRIGMVEDIYGEWHDLTDLPAELETAGSLDLSRIDVCRMPRKLVVNGDFTAPRNMEHHPDVFHVSGSYNFRKLPPIEGDFKVGMMSISEECGYFVLPERMDVAELTIEFKSRYLPRRFEVTGNLALNVRDRRQVPDQLKVGGSLDLEGTTVKVWNGDIDCGALEVRLARPIQFNGKVRVRGDLYVDRADTTFHKPIRVSGNADFSGLGEGRKIAALPSRMYVGGDLDLSKCEIGRMPRHLEVGCDLILTDAEFDSVMGLKRVGGTLRIEGTSVTELPQGLLKVGALMAAKSRLDRLPDGFTTKSNLVVIGTPMEELPNGLVVGGNLFVQDTAIETLPDDAVVKGRVLGISGFRNVVDRQGTGRLQVRSLRR